MCAVVKLELWTVVLLDPVSTVFGRCTTGPAWTVLIITGPQSVRAVVVTRLVVAWTPTL
jgi:hypothetical protein